MARKATPKAEDIPAVDEQVEQVLETGEVPEEKRSESTALTPDLDRIQESNHKAGHPKADDRLNEIVRRGIRNHKNPNHADLIQHQKRVNQNIQVGKALKELKAKGDESDFEE